MAVIEVIQSFLRRLRRRYLMWRHPNLEFGYGSSIVGRFRFRGDGRGVIGAGSRLIGVSLDVEGDLVIGDRCFLNGASIVCRQKVSIGEMCLISDAYITDTDFHNIEPELRHQPPGPKVTRPVQIGRNVWIGDRAVILKGSVVGNDAVIGSNAVVRGAMAERAVCIGNPAEIVRYL
jgi:acetyltransferase-like isoleucine patch superfamily enzyme